MRTAAFNVLLRVVALGVIAGFLTACAVDERWGDDRTLPRADRPVGVERTHFDAVAGNPDHFFMMQASHFNGAITDLSRIALDRAADQQVRDFAQMMIDDHADLEDDLQRHVRDVRISLPARPEWARQAPQSHLRALSGWQFDEEYVNMMIADHARAVAIYESALQRTTDSEVRELADRGLRMMRHHLEEARRLSASLRGGAMDQRR